MVTPDLGPVVQRLVLGAKVRQLRVAAGFAEVEATNDELLRWYRGKLSKVETGLYALKPKEVEALITLYRVTGPEATELRQLATAARRQSAPERVPDTARQYVAFERAASDIRMIYGEVPGVFQTAEFARAQFLSSPVVLGAQVDSWADAREQRGERVRAAVGTSVTAILGEPALWWEVGGPGVLRRQLQRLVEFTELPHVTIRLLPFASGGAAGISTPFTLLYIEPAQVQIAYAETLTGADYYRTTGAYVAAFEQASQRALTEDESREALMRRINELG